MSRWDGACYRYDLEIDSLSNRNQYITDAPLYVSNALTRKRKQSIPSAETHVLFAESHADRVSFDLRLNATPVTIVNI